MRRDLHVLLPVTIAALSALISAGGCDEDAGNASSSNDYYDKLTDADNGIADRDSLGSVKVIARFLPVDEFAQQGVERTPCNLAVLLYLGGSQEEAHAIANLIAEPGQSANLPETTPQYIWIKIGTRKIYPSIIVREPVGEASPYEQILIAFPEKVCDLISDSETVDLHIMHPIRRQTSTVLHFSGEQIKKYIIRT